MPDLTHHLTEIEAELARQDREFATSLAELRRYAEADGELVLDRELAREFEEAWSVAATPVVVAPPTPGARC